LDTANSPWLEWLPEATEMHVLVDFANLKPASMKSISFRGEVKLDGR
jgi:hypothetical protein